MGIKEHQSKEYVESVYEKFLTGYKKSLYYSGLDRYDDQMYSVEKRGGNMITKQKD
jgi:hypothetical protein